MKNVNKKYDAMFFGLLLNIKAPFFTWGDIWYQFKLSVRYFKRFFHTIWWFRGTNPQNIYDILKVALEQRLEILSKDDVDGLMGYDDDLNLIKKGLNRSIEILNNIEKDDYNERCGYDYNHKFYFTPVEGTNHSRMNSTATEKQRLHNKEVSIKAQKIKDCEIIELFNILGNKKMGIGNV